ncbi:6514_t:CDS:2 [Acaulospora colombiana]|uniref:6514_t:CDS:1 n=1 Tax=Acaulospora colombiana TaxID=27376 RepID=A0ACA9KJB8_9GLOM|nr:6514_t:CDS:2 [Acaulospora colombiana]
MVNLKRNQNSLSPSSLISPFFLISLYQPSSFYPFFLTAYLLIPSATSKLSSISTLLPRKSHHHKYHHKIPESHFKVVCNVECWAAAVVAGILILFCVSCVVHDFVVKRKNQKLNVNKKFSSVPDRGRNTRENRFFGNGSSRRLSATSLYEGRLNLSSLMLGKGGEVEGARAAREMQMKEIREGRREMKEKRRR